MGFLSPWEGVIRLGVSGLEEVCRCSLTRETLLALCEAVKRKIRVLRIITLNTLSVV